MTDLLPFGSVEKCPKCGSPKIPSDSWVDCKCFSNLTTRGDTMYLREYLRMTCRCCGYSWSEACLDAKGDES